MHGQQNIKLHLLLRVQTAMRLMQPPIRWVPRSISLGVKCRGSEADNSPYLKPRLEISGIVPSLPHMPSYHEKGQLYLCMKADGLF